MPYLDSNAVTKHADDARNTDPTKTFCRPSLNTLSQRHALLLVLKVLQITIISHHFAQRQYTPKDIYTKINVLL